MYTTSAIRGTTLAPCGRLVASSTTLQVVKKRASDLVHDYAEAALMKKIEAGESASIHFYLRFKGGSRGYGLSVKRAGDEKGPPIKTEIAFNFDGIPAGTVREVLDTMAKARVAAVDSRAMKSDGDSHASGCCSDNVTVTYRTARS